MFLSIILHQWRGCCLWRLSFFPSPVTPSGDQPLLYRRLFQSSPHYPMWHLNIFLSWLSNRSASPKLLTFCFKLSSFFPFFKSLGQNSLSLLDTHKWGKLGDFFVCPQPSIVSWQLSAGSGKSLREGSSSNKPGLLFLDHRLWIDLLFEVMKKGVWRLRGEFRSAVMPLRSGNRFLSNSELGNVGLFW